MKLVLDFDDFHWLRPENCIDALNTLVRIVPSIKISLFTIPLLRNSYLYEDIDWCSNVNGLIKSNNIRLCVHGYEHTMLEFEHINHSDAIVKITNAEDVFTKSKLPFLRVFKGPNWGLNFDTLNALDQLGYTHIFSHYDHKFLVSTSGIKIRYYNWNLKDEYDNSIPDTDIVYAHGHTWDVCDNGIDRCVDRILEVCNEYNPEFLFANEE